MAKATTKVNHTVTTGTVYALVDPRDGAERYIGATKKTLQQRLNGHMKGAQTAPAVRRWIAELHEADGLVPEIKPIVEEVPEADLAYRETHEITIRLGAGLPLLNKVSTVAGRELLEQRRRAEREARERDAWAALVEPIRLRLGGPIPPRVEATVPVPQLAWSFIAHPDRDLLGEVRQTRLGLGMLDENTLKRYSRLSRMETDAQKTLGHEAEVAWGHLFAVSDDRILRSRLLRLVDTAVTDVRWGDPKSLSAYLTLLPWSMVVVGPWRKLASNAGIGESTEEFIDWVSDDSVVRDALRIAASVGRFGEVTEEVLHFADKVRPAAALAAVAAAHLQLTPDGAIREPIRQALISLAEDRQVTEPMAHLLKTIDPRAVTSVYGADRAAEIDTKLGLPHGTAGAVVRELDTEYGAFYPPLRRMALRSTGAIPTRERPDYEGWSGPMVPPMRGITATLVHAGLIPARDGYVNDRLRLLAVAEDVLEGRRGRVAPVALPLAFP